MQAPEAGDKKQSRETRVVDLRMFQRMRMTSPLRHERLKKGDNIALECRRHDGDKILIRVKTALIITCQSVTTAWSSDNALESRYCLLGFYRHCF